MTMPADNQIINGLKLAGKEVVTSNCEATLSIALKTLANDPTALLSSNGGTKRCYLDTTIWATFRLTGQDDLLAETPELRVDYRTQSAGGLLAGRCNEQKSEAPFEPALIQAAELGGAYFWGPADASEEWLMIRDYLDDQFLRQRGPQRAKFVPVLIAAAEANPYNEDIYVAFRELGADGAAALPFLTDIARSDRPEAHFAAIALEEIYRGIYPDVLSIFNKCEPALMYPKVSDLDKIAQAIDGGDYLQSQCAYIAAARLGPQSAPLVPRLAASLEKEKADPVRTDTILTALGYIGPEAIAAVPDILTYWIEHPDENLPDSYVTLQRITGQSLPDSTEAWVTWWNDYIGVK